MLVFNNESLNHDEKYARAETEYLAGTEHRMQSEFRCKAVGVRQEPVCKCCGVTHRTRRGMWAKQTVYRCSLNHGLSAAMRACCVCEATSSRPAMGLQEQTDESMNYFSLCNAYTYYMENISSKRSLYYV